MLTLLSPMVRPLMKSGSPCCREPRHLSSDGSVAVVAFPSEAAERVREYEA